MNKYARFSKVADWILDKKCRNKVSFDSKQEAYQKGQDTYQCEECGKWHRATVAKGRKAKGFFLG